MRLAPGACIGIVGGGQLGRMTALAAARLGYRCHVLTPEPDSPAAQVTDRATVAAYDDAAALERFAGAVDVVTIEFENLPVEPLAWLAGRVPVRPGAGGAGDLPGPAAREGVPRPASASPRRPGGRCGPATELARGARRARRGR